MTGSGNLWVAENSISYDGGPWNLTVSILELRGEKVARERIYITQPWEAAEWRAPWRAAETAVQYDSSVSFCKRLTMGALVISRSACVLKWVCIGAFA